MIRALGYLMIEGLMDCGIWDLEDGEFLIGWTVSCGLWDQRDLRMGCFEYSKMHGYCNTLSPTSLDTDHFSTVSTVSFHNVVVYKNNNSLYFQTILFPNSLT